MCCELPRRYVGRGWGMSHWVTGALCGVEVGVADGVVGEGI
ncbi:MAG: hypothetical protein ACK4SY_08950 [Pyrobaculum sp.]